MLCFMRKPKGMETARLPCRIVVYGDLPIGVRLAFYSSRSVKIVRCVNVAFDYPGSGGGFSIRCRIGTADVSRAPESLPQTPRMVVAAAQPQMQRISVQRFGAALSAGRSNGLVRRRRNELMPIRHRSIPCRSSRDRTRAWILASCARRLHTMEMKRPARSLSIRRTISSIWFRVTQGDTLRHRRRPPRVHMVRRARGLRQERMAGLGAAG